MSKGVRQPWRPVREPWRREDAERVDRTRTGSDLLEPVPHGCLGQPFGEPGRAQRILARDLVPRRTRRRHFEANPLNAL